MDILIGYSFYSSPKRLRGFGQMISKAVFDIIVYIIMPVALFSKTMADKPKPLGFFGGINGSERDI
jgi:hypothetical protein